MLFKNTNKLVVYAEITASTNFITIKPTIDRIEELHLIPALGKELYNELNGDYTAASAEADLSEEYQALLTHCRKVIGAYLGYYFAPIGELKFSDAGLRRSETASEKTAFQYQVTNFREACLRNGDAATETLLEFLNENKDDYSTWENSEAFTRYSSLFIKSGKEFNYLFPSHSPYRNYLAMRSKMQDVEEQNIRAALGDTLFDDLKTKDKEGTLSDKETVLVSRIKKAIANFTIAFSIPLLAVRIDANGITVATTGGRANHDELSVRQNAADNNISHIIRSTQDAAQAWLKSAITYLDANATGFTGWTVADTDTTDTTDINTSLNGTFGLI